MYFQEHDVVQFILNSELITGTIVFNPYEQIAFVEYNYNDETHVEQFYLHELVLKSETRLTEENLLELGFEIHSVTISSSEYQYKLAENKYISVCLFKFQSISFPIFRFYETVSLIKYSEDPRFSEDDNYINISDSENTGFYSLEKLKMLIQSIPHERV